MAATTGVVSSNNNSAAPRGHTSMPVVACTVAVALSLYLIYFVSLSAFAAKLDSSQLDALQMVIIVSQIGRIAVVFAMFGFKPARLEFLLVLLSVETFIVMGLILVYLLIPSPFFSSLAHSIFSTWMAALFTVLPSYLILSGAIEMSKYRSLIATLLSVLLEFGFLSFSATTMLLFKGSFSFANFFDFLIVAVKTDVAAGSIPQLSTVFLVVPSVVVFCALMIYAAIPGASGRMVPKIAFLMPLGATLASLGWVATAVTIMPNTLLSFTIPGVVIVGVLWALMRG